jgi:hypothetical protein
MPAVKKDLPPGEIMYHPVSFGLTHIQLGPDFEVADDHRKVRCTVCLARNPSEPWINRSNATSHTKSARHNHSVAAKRQRANEVVRDNEVWKERASETKKLFGDDFIPMDAVPSVRVTRNEPVTIPSQIRSDEEEDMMTRVFRYLETPQKDGPGSHPIDSWKVMDQSLEAQVEQVIAGNLTALGPDEGRGDNVLENLINTARVWIPLPLPSRVIDSTPPRLTFVR